LDNRGLEPTTTATTWIENADTIAARGWDLSPRNPARLSGQLSVSSVELTAEILERIREVGDIAEHLHELMSDTDGEADNGFERDGPM
jgi:hypothetical protein